MSEAVPLTDIIVSAVPGFASGSRSEDGVLQVRMNCVSTDGSLDVEQALRVPSPANVDRFFLEIGDVLFNATNSPNLVGKTGLFTGWPEPVTCSNHFLRLRGDPQRVHPSYLARWLHWQWRGRVFEGMCTQWVNQAAVRKERLLALRIPLPPLPEQRRIAAILDKADAIRRKRQESIRLLDELLRSTFLEMFGDPVRNERGWKVVRLGEVASVVTGNTPPRSVRAYYGDALEWVKSDNVGLSGPFVAAASERLSQEGAGVARTVDRGSVLVVCIAGSRSSIGRAAIANRPVAFNQQINALSPQDGLDFRYLYGALLAGKALVQELSTDSMKGLVTKGRLERARIPYPPRRAQRGFAEAFERWVGIWRDSRGAADAATTLFNALSQRAFQGRI